METGSDTRIAQALSFGWARVEALLGLICALLDSGCTATGPALAPDRPLTRGVRRAALRLVRIAEALTRRLVCLMAFQIDPRSASRRDGSGSASPCFDPRFASRRDGSGSGLLDQESSPERAPCEGEARDGVTSNKPAPQSGRKTSPQRPATAGIQGGTDATGSPWVRTGGGDDAQARRRTPGLRLFEYIPSPRLVLTGTPAPVADCPPRPPLRPVDEDVAAGSLGRRVAALQGVLGDPRRAALRLLRRLQAVRWNGAPRLHNLRPGWPPGVSRRAGADAGRAGELSDLVVGLALARAGPPDRRLAGAA